MKMKELITFKKLRAYAIDESFSNPYYRKLEYAIETILESKVLEDTLNEEHFLYPKYLFQEDKEMELYFFTQSKLIKCTFLDDGIINLKTRLLEDISYYELKNVDINNKNISLDIVFTDEETLNFNSNDSNTSWKYKYFNAILEIHKIIS